MTQEKKIIDLGKEYLNDWISENPEKRFDLEGLTFENEDFSGWRLSKALMNNSKFINCNFSEADLSEISAIKAEFINSNFSKTALYRANLSRSFIKNSNFENSWLYRCVFSNALIVDCNFHLAKAQKVRWPEGFHLE
ncbi:MAG: hypothetical protein CL772_03775 [Chloroflexi bacterium]|nr:hypothetical protein [Chloroflexota bacterium]|tara:strand:+ start:16066 stop:16476 length:411 start_codon:yes stop_codon:yes gene_type:complete